MPKMMIRKRTIRKTEIRSIILNLFVEKMKVFVIAAASFANADVRFLDKSATSTATNTAPSTTASGNEIASAFTPVSTTPKGGISSLTNLEAGGASTSSGGYIIDDTILATKQT